LLATLNQVVSLTKKEKNHQVALLLLEVFVVMLLAHILGNETQLLRHGQLTFEVNLFLDIPSAGLGAITASNNHCNKQTNSMV
jgi:hypothetical protein